MDPKPTWEPFMLKMIEENHVDCEIINYCFARHILHLFTIRNNVCIESGQGEGSDLTVF